MVYLMHDNLRAMNCGEFFEKILGCDSGFRGHFFMTPSFARGRAPARVLLYLYTNSLLHYLIVRHPSFPFLSSIRGVKTPGSAGKPRIGSLGKGKTHFSAFYPSWGLPGRRFPATRSYFERAMNLLACCE